MVMIYLRKEKTVSTLFSSAAGGHPSATSGPVARTTQTRAVPGPHGRGCLGTVCGELCLAAFNSPAAGRRAGAGPAASPFWCPAWREALNGAGPTVARAVPVVLERGPCGQQQGAR